MKQSDIPSIRLSNQHLTHPDFISPADVVRWFGAVQAQDYLGSLWAVGQRMKNSTEKVVEEALAARTIVRSWPMRGTLHFVTANDIRWMLKLLAPRVIKRSASRYKELELTEETFKKSEKVIIDALMGGKQKTREELFSILRTNKISPDGQRGIHILGRLAMEGLLCFGARAGKQFTFTLLDEWIPAAKSLAHDEALEEITRRYFTSHGPATIQDFVWWTGLTVTEAKKGIALVGKHLVHETFDAKIYIHVPSKIAHHLHKAYLLPAYDEYTVAYKNRSDIIESNVFIQAGNGLRPTIVFEGQIIGTWQRELKKHAIVLKPHFFYDVTQKQRSAIDEAAKHYGNFLERKLELL